MPKDTRDTEPKAGKTVRHLWRSLLKDIFSPITIEMSHLVEIAWPLAQPPHVMRHASAVVSSRVQLVAAIFAVLVPLCMVADAFVLPWPEWMEMTLLRVLSSAVFLGVMWARHVVDEATDAWFAKSVSWAMLFAMNAVPIVFHLASIRILESQAGNPGAALLSDLYALMPSIVLAGLALFPLTAAETIAFALPAFASAILGFLADGGVGTLSAHISSLWLMVLLTGASTFCGMSQLHYMAGLVSRAMTDPLTGVYTRRSGNDTLDLFFRMAVQQRMPLAVVFFDIDHFKSVNDTYGHEAGDHALRDFAAALRSGLRGSDILIRWGGEEFVAVLVNTNEAGARLVITRLLERGFGRRPDGSPITASIGVAERQQDGVRDWSSLVQLADDRMYRAKKNGRNRVVLADGVILGTGAAEAKPSDR